MKYLIGALVILALLFLIWWFLSRGKQAKLDEQRTEAARIRAGANERGAALRGQEASAQQADERASAARAEAEAKARQAEDSAREAQRVEDEARRHQDELERARLSHDAEQRRADEIDPDVEVANGDPRPLPEDLDDDVRPLDETHVHTPVPATSVSQREISSSSPEPAVEAEPTVAESERTTEPVAQTETSNDRRAWGAGAAAAGAGATAVGSAYAATCGNVTDDEVARLASGADYADKEPVVAGPVAEPTVDETVASEPAQKWGAGHTADTATADVDPSDSGEPLDAASTTEWDTAETTGSTQLTDTDPRVAASTTEWGSTQLKDTEPATQEWDADQTSRTATVDGDSWPSPTGEVDPAAGDTAIIADVEDYASTEPLPAENFSVTGDTTSSASASGATGPATYEGSRDDLGRTDVPSTEDTDTDTAESAPGSAANDELVTNDGPDADEVDTDDTPPDEQDLADEPTTEDTWQDPDPTTDTTANSADGDTDGSVETEPVKTHASGGLVTPGETPEDAHTSDAGVDTDPRDTEASADAGDGGDATHWPDGTDRINAVEGDFDNESSRSEFDNASEEPTQSDGADPQAGDSDSGGSARRISDVEEIRDGGFGVGSAAPFEDGAQPSDHPVQAYNDTRTFRVPGASGYDSAEPDVWFYDEAAARRAGFTASES